MENAADGGEGKQTGMWVYVSQDFHCGDDMELNEVGEMFGANRSEFFVSYPYG